MKKSSYSYAALFKQIEKVYKDIQSRNLSKRQTFMLVSGLIFILLFVSGGVYYTIRIFTRAETCFSVAQVQSDSRCLYIYNNQVFEKGTRAEPHRGNPCGSDVTAIIPNSHLIDKVGRLDPNYQGNICANQPAPTTAQPTAQPTSPPPTNAPQPTAVPPTQASQTGSTTAPTATRTPTPINPASQSNSSTTITSTPVQQVTGALSPTISMLPKTGTTEDVITAISAALLLTGALGLIF